MDKQNRLLVDMIQEGLHANGWARFRVISNSMQPLIRKDDWIQAAGLSFDGDLHFGDIVLFRRNGDIIIHRVIRRGAGKVITKGDRCLCADAPVLREDVLAKVTRLERGNRIINLKSRWWKIVNIKMAVVSRMVAVCFSSFRKISQKLVENV
jgi:signal peptidase I